MKVFVVGSFGVDSPRMGETDWEIVDLDYVRVHWADGSRSQLCHKASVFVATETNLQLYNAHKQLVTELYDWIGHDMQETLNKMVKSTTKE